MPIPAFLKQALTPGSIGFLMLSATVYLVLRYGWPRGRRISRWWALAVGAAYLVMSVPLVATRIADRLPATDATAERSMQAIDTLIILDGDNRVGRAETAERVWRVANPAMIYVLGADWVKDAIAAAGVPVDRIAQVAGSYNTRDQMAWVQRFMARTPAPRAALVASRLQMPRIAALVRAANLSLPLIASPIDDEPPRTGFRAFVPTYIGLRASRDALYEHAALAFYSWRGWIKKM